MFSKKQCQFQSVDDNIAEMRKLAKKIMQMRSSFVICYAILNGLKSNQTPYITQQNPQTL